MWNEKKKNTPKIQARIRSIATVRDKEKMNWRRPKKCAESEGETLKIEAHTNMKMATETEKVEDSGWG